MDGRSQQRADSPAYRGCSLGDQSMSDDQEVFVRMATTGLETMSAALAWVMQRVDSDFAGALGLELTVSQASYLEHTDGVSSKADCWTASIEGTVRGKPAMGTWITSQ